MRSRWRWKRLEGRRCATRSEAASFAKSAKVGASGYQLAFVGHNEHGATTKVKGGGQECPPYKSKVKSPTSRKVREKWGTLARFEI
jgi:hypothetical protein